MRSFCVLLVGCLATCRALAASPESAGELLKDIDAQTQALRGAKPPERPALADRLVQDHMQLSEMLLTEGKFPAALDALRKAKGLTINLLPARAQELSGQLDVRMTVAQWRQANDGRGLHAEYFKGKEFGEKLADRTDYRIDFLWDRAAPVEGLTGEAFSARWTGFIVAPRPGTWNVVALYDDRCRMWIDDVPLIDDWKDGHGRAEALMKFDGKPQPIKVEFCNYGGHSHFSLRWAPLGEKGLAMIPGEALFTDKQAAARFAGKPLTPPKGLGLAAEYFDGNFRRVVATRVDWDIDFLWQRAWPQGIEDFSVRWKGYLRAPKPGKYRLTLIHDNGARLWIDNEPVIDGWSGDGTHNAQVWLSGKPQPMVLELINTGGDAHICLQWQMVEGDEKVMVIPPSAFFTDLKTAQHAP